MSDERDLFAAAYRAERISSRRLAKHTGLSEFDALKKTLEKVAGQNSLRDLIAARMQTQAKEADSIAARKARTAEKEARRTIQQPIDSTAWHAWFDGATNPNPGAMGIGALLIGPSGERCEISRPAGQGDSTEAEYLALIAVLEVAVPIQPARLLIHGDSQVVIHDVTGVCRITAPDLQSLSARAVDLVAQLASVTFIWLPRERNAAADALSQRAIARAGSSFFGILDGGGKT